MTREGAAGEHAAFEDMFPRSGLLPRFVVGCVGTVVEDTFLHTEVGARGSVTIVSHTGQSAGGPVSHVAQTLAKLGLSAHAVGWVGCDDAGGRVRRALAGAGVDVSRLRATHHDDSGRSHIIVEPDGERTVYYSPGANTCFRADDVTPDRRDSWTICHLGYPALLPSCPPAALAALFSRLRMAGIGTSVATTWFDAEHPTDELAQVLANTDFLFANFCEARHLAGVEASQLSEAVVHECAATILKRGPRAVVITLGSAGSYILTSGDVRLGGGQSPAHLAAGTLAYAPAFDVPGRVNTTGAGDVFAAGFLAALLAGATPRQSLATGNLVAALHVAGKDLPSLRNVPAGLHSMPQHLPAFAPRLEAQAAPS